MTQSQILALVGLILYATLGLIVGIKQSWQLKNPFGIATGFQPLGAFVWGDLLVITPFWIATGFISLYAENLTIFNLLFWIFWLVRARGEVQYWIAEQFTHKKRNKPHTLQFNSLFGGGEATYFGYQVFWQIISVIALFMILKVLFGIAL